MRKKVEYMKDEVLILVVQKLNENESKLDYMIKNLDQLLEGRPPVDKVYELKEALPLLKMCANTFRKKERMGEITCIREGRKVYIRQSDIDRYWGCKRGIW